MIDSASFCVTARRVVIDAREEADRFLRIEDGVIIAIDDRPARDLPLLDLGERVLIPGLIDLHVHGRDGCDVMDADPQSLAVMSRSLAAHGVTGFLATTVTGAWDTTLRALTVVGDAVDTRMPGARLLGAYSEGLFFCDRHRGAHNAAFFLEPTRARIDAMLDAARGALKVVALAPEAPGAVAIIPYLVERGVRVMLGHTDASYDETRRALADGASGGVHVFNGMRGIHHREPGCAGAVLLERCLVEVIADGTHLHPAILELVARVKRVGEVALISDCINAGGLSDGQYRLGEMAVTVSDGIARAPNGSLAGSTLTLERAVANMRTMAGIDLPRAVAMASTAPAAFLRLDDRLGSLAPGRLADMAALEPDGSVAATWVGGRQVFARDSVQDRKAEAFVG